VSDFFFGVWEIVVTILYLQLATPIVVVRAVRIVTMMLMMVFQVSFFIVLFFSLRFTVYGLQFTVYGLQFTVYGLQFTVSLLSLNRDLLN